MLCPVHVKKGPTGRLNDMLSLNVVFKRVITNFHRIHSPEMRLRKGQIRDWPNHRRHCCSHPPYSCCCCPWSCHWCWQFQWIWNFEEIQNKLQNSHTRCFQQNHCSAQNHCFCHRLLLLDKVARLPVAHFQFVRIHADEHSGQHTTWSGCRSNGLEMANLFAF